MIYAEIFAFLLWAGASIAVMVAGFMLMTEAGDMDVPLAVPAMIGAVLVAGAGFVSAGYSLSWLTHAAELAR